MILKSEGILLKKTSGICSLVRGECAILIATN